jgi:hypothetical protein
MIVSDEDDDVDDAVVQTYYQVLINCLFQALFHLFRIVPFAWNKVFLYGQRVCCLFYLFVPLFHIYI